MYDLLNTLNAKTMKDQYFVVDKIWLVFILLTSNAAILTKLQN